MQKYEMVLKDTCKIGVTVCYFVGRGMKTLNKKYLHFCTSKMRDIVKYDNKDSGGIIYLAYHIPVGVFAEYRFCVLSVHGLA